MSRAQHNPRVIRPRVESNTAPGTAPERTRPKVLPEDEPRLRQYRQGPLLDFLVANPDTDHSLSTLTRAAGGDPAKQRDRSTVSGALRRTAQQNPERLEKLRTGLWRWHSQPLPELDERADDGTAVSRETSDPAPAPATVWLMELVTDLPDGRKLVRDSDTGELFTLKRAEL